MTSNTQKYTENTLNETNETGLEGFAGTDIRVPFRRMVQAMSRDVDGLDANFGDFIDKKAKKNYGKKMRVVLLKVRKTRQLDMKDLDKTSKSQDKRCWSFDGITPARRVENPLASKCDECQYRLRDLQYDLLLLDVDESLETGFPSVFRFEAKKSSRRPAEDHISAILRTGKPARTFEFELSTHKAASENKFVVAQFGEPKPVDDEALLALAEEAYELYGRTHSVSSSAA